MEEPLKIDFKMLLKLPKFENRQNLQNKHREPWNITEHCSSVGCQPYT